jgi:hypothetical protein
MKLYLSCLNAVLLLSACQSDPITQKPAPESAWQASTLSEQTIAKANAAVLDYQQCLNVQAQQRVLQRADPRAIADAVLQACEARLGGIKAAYDAEHVPAAISERYMRQTRSRGAQNLLRFVMSVHAMRAGEEQEAAKAKKK